MAGARIQLKRATASAWASANTVLFAGEIGLETDTNKFKIGNGSTAFNSLPYFNGNLAGSNLNDLADVTIVSAAAGQFLQWNGSAWINAYSEASTYVGDTPPASPSEGDLWFDSSTLDIFVRYGGAWLQINTENPIEELSDLVDVSAETAEPNQFLKYDGTEWVASSPILPTTISTQTSNYLITLSDVNKLIEMNVGTANTVTVPTNLSHAIPIGSRIEIVQYGSGKTQIIGDTGVTVRFHVGNYISGQYGCVILIKRAINEWILCGELSAT